MEIIKLLFAAVGRVFLAWWTFAGLLIHVTIAIPYFTVIAIVLTAIPVVYIYIAARVPWWAMMYMTAVFVGVGIYVMKHFNDVDTIEEPLDGRGVTSEEKAERRSRSIIRNSSRR